MHTSTESRPDSDLLPACIGALAAFVVAGLLVPLRDSLGGTNAALILLVVIVAAASIGGRVAGATTALASALAFNFLYTQPYLTLRIHSSKDVITTVLLFVLGISVGEIVTYARRNTYLARKRRLDISDLHQLSDMVRVNAPQGQVIDRACQLLSRELHLSSCRFESPSEPHTSLPVIDHRGLIAAPLRHAPGGFELPAGGVAVRVEVDEHTFGQFVLVPATPVTGEPRRGVSLLDRQMAVLVASIVSPALTSSAI